MKKLLVAITFSLLNIGLFAQIAQNIRGVVIDQVSKAPLAGANVSIVSGDVRHGVTSAEDGRFFFEMKPIGRYDAFVSFVGYETAMIRNVELTAGKELHLVVEMIEQVVKVDEIKVVAIEKGEARNQMAALSARPFSVKETEKFAGSLGDPSRMASNFAGVVTANDSRNDIIIRGNSPQGLLWKLEGVNIPNPNHFGALGSTGGPVNALNNNLLANSDFFTGAFPAEYGNALAGVFDLKMRNGNQSKHEFVGQIGFNGFEFGAEGPFSKDSKASYLVNYRYSVLDVMAKLGFDVADGAVPEYQDLSFKVNIPTKRAGTFSLFGMGGDSYIQFDATGEEGGSSYDTGNNSRTRNGSTLGILGLTHRIFTNGKASFFSTLSATHQEVKTQVDSVGKEGWEKRFFGEKNREQRMAANTRFAYKADSRNTINAGLSLESFSIDYQDSVSGEVYNPVIAGYVHSLSTHERSLLLGQAFAEWQHRFPNRVTIYSGLHHQYFFFNNSSSIEPRFSIAYRSLKNTKYSLGYGLHAQIQPLYVYFNENYDATNDKYYKTNLELDMAKAHHFVAGFDRLLTPNLKVKLETYYQHLFDVAVTPDAGHFSMVNAGNSFNQERVGNLVNEGTGRNYGVELTIEKYLADQYYFLITASVFDSKYQGYDKVWRNTEFNTNFVLNALGGYEIKLNDRSSIDLNLRTLWSGGKRNLYIDLEKSIEYGSEAFDHSKAYSEREKDYFRLDFRVSFKSNSRKSTQEWALDITNITNHKNIYTRYFDKSKNNIAFVYQQMLFPMFLYRITF